MQEPDCNKIKTALHTLAQLLAPRTTEKTSDVVPPSAAQASSPPPLDKDKEKPNGQGRNPAAVYAGAKKAPIAHAELEHGTRCPERLTVYMQKECRPLVRITGQAPLRVTVYELERLRCLCLWPAVHGD